MKTFYWKSIPDIRWNKRYMLVHCGKVPLLQIVITLKEILLVKKNVIVSILKILANFHLKLKMLFLHTLNA
jgi:hypothetical protein